MLNQFLDALAPGWVGSVIGLIGIVVGVGLYVFSRRRSVLAYRTLGIRVLGSASAKLSQDVTVQFRGRTIPRLTRSVVVLWNDGERTIAGQDIVANDPLRIEVGEGDSILSFTIVKTSRVVTQATGLIDIDRESCATIGFDFLDPNDGFVIEILHSGIERNPTMAGTIRGIPSGPKNLGKVAPKGPRPRAFPFVRMDSFLLYVLFAASIALALGSIVLSLLDTGAAIGTNSSKRPVLGIIGAGYAAFCGLLMWTARRRYPKSLRCEQLE